MKSIVVFLFFFFGITTALAAEVPVIGSVRVVNGPAFIFRQSEKIPASVGLHLTNKDILQTGKNGSMGVIFRDNGLLSLGSNTQVELSRFEFDPLEKKTGFTSRLIHGSLVYLTGIIAKLKRNSVEFITPTSIIGVRGTHIAIRSE